MKEIQDIVNAKVLEMSASGEIQKQVEEGVKLAINNAIKKQFDSWGNITKQLDSVFNEQLKVSARDLNIPCFNSVMTEVVNSSINEFYKGQAVEKLQSLMQEKLSPLPDTMKLSEFVSMICKVWHEDDYDNFDKVDECATVEFEQSNYGWFDLKMWKLRQSSYGRTNTENVHLTFGKDGKLRGRHGSTNPYYLFDEDALIFKAYAQGVVFTGLDDFDEDDCELSLKDSDY